MPSWGKRKTEEAGPSCSETGGGRREKPPRRHSAPGGRAGDSVSGQRGRTERADCHHVQDVSCSRVKSVSEAMAEAGRIFHESAGAIKSKPEAVRADAQEQLGPPYVHVWVAFLRSLAATRGLAPERVAVLKSYWESNVVKGAPVQPAAHVRHCRAKPCKKIEGKEGWTRIVFCLEPGHSPFRGSAGSSTAAAERGEEVRPRPKRPLRARSIEAPNTDARSTWHDPCARMTRIVRECRYLWKDLAWFFNTAKQDEGRYAFLKFLDHDTVENCMALAQG